MYDYIYTNIQNKPWLLELWTNLANKVGRHLVVYSGSISGEDSGAFCSQWCNTWPILDILHIRSWFTLKLVQPHVHGKTPHFAAFAWWHHGQNPQKA